MWVSRPRVVRGSLLKRLVVSLVPACRPDSSKQEHVAQNSRTLCAAHPHPAPNQTAVQRTASILNSIQSLIFAVLV
jgi:hypothetical protein